MPGYHKYVFNSQNRTFVGQFEEMYQAEKDEGFDAWNQDNLRARDDAAACTSVLQGRFYDTLIDLGCGKGALTAHLAQHAKRVLGTDISPTAIKIAGLRYPHLQFEELDLSEPELVSQFLQKELQKPNESTLIVMLQVLSYLERWQELLKSIAKFRSEILIVLYIPEEPIGFVKTPEELQDFLAEYFDEISTSATTDRQYVKHFRSRNMVGM